MILAERLFRRGRADGDARARPCLSLGVAVHGRVYREFRYTSGTVISFDRFRQTSLSYCHQSTFSSSRLRLHPVHFASYTPLPANS